MALNILDEEEALETLTLIRELGEINESLQPESA
jgi:hydrogenase maturation factor